MLEHLGREDFDFELLKRMHAASCNKFRLSFEELYQRAQSFLSCPGSLPQPKPDWVARESSTAPHCQLQCGAPPWKRFFTEEVWNAIKSCQTNAEEEHAEIGCAACPDACGAQHLHDHKHSIRRSGLRARARRFFATKAQLIPCAGRGRLNLGDTVPAHLPTPDEIHVLDDHICREVVEMVD